MKKTILAISLTLILGACASPDKYQPTVMPDQVAGTSAMNAENMANDPLKDNQNILSKRIVYFDFDQNTIKPEFSALLQAHAAHLRQHPERSIRLEGHADERGSRDYNLALGQQRNMSVVRMLTTFGVLNSRIESISFGEDKPASMDHNEASWAMNRRVEIVYDGE